MVKKKHRPLKLILLCLILILISVVLLQLQNNGFKTTPIVLTLQDLPADLNGLKIVFISDVHSEYSLVSPDELTECVNSLEPDLILFGGDIADEHSTDFDFVEEILSGLSCPNIAAVFGNHENSLSFEMRNRLISLYHKYNVDFLSDQTTVFTFGQTDLCVSGCADLAYWGKDDLSYLQDHPLSVKPVENSFNLLLVHRANLYPVTGELGFDLICSGHLHGGQIRLPFIGGILSPNGTYFPKYTSGLYTDYTSPITVSRGLANTTSIPRFLNSPDILLITLMQQ